MHNDLIHRKLFHKIHLKMRNTKHVNNIENSFKLSSFKEKKNFENKVVAVFGSGSLSIEAKFFLKNRCKFCYIVDLDKSIQKHSSQNLKIYKGKYKFLFESIERTSIKKNSIDYLICSGVIHHMKNDKKGYQEIYRVLKNNGKALIIVNGKGGIISEIFNLVLRPFFTVRKNKILLEKILRDSYLKKFNNFLLAHYTYKEKKIFNYIKRQLNKELIFTFKDRVYSPLYKSYDYASLKKFLKKIGFKKIFRIKKKMKYDNIRFLLTPLYSDHKNEISKILYGDGMLHLLCKK